MKKLIASYGAGEAIAKGLNIVLTLGLAAVIDLDSYGVISVLIAIELVLAELIIFGQHTAVLRFYQTYRNTLPRLYSASLTLVLVSTCAVLLLYALLPLHEWRIVSLSIHNRDLILEVAPEI